MNTTIKHASFDEINRQNNVKHHHRQGKTSFPPLLEYFKKTIQIEKKRRKNSWVTTNLASTCFCSVSVYYFPTDEEEDEEDGPTLKERLLAAGMKFIDTFCVWDCCEPWLKLQSWISFIVFDPFVELFITLCIVVNTMFMALDHHDMDKHMEKILKRGNYVSIPVLVWIQSFQTGVKFDPMPERPEPDIDSRFSGIGYPMRTLVLSTNENKNYGKCMK